MAVVMGCWWPSLSFRTVMTGIVSYMSLGRWVSLGLLARAENLCSGSVFWEWLHGLESELGRHGSWIRRSLKQGPRSHCPYTSDGFLGQWQLLG